MFQNIKWRKQNNIANIDDEDFSDIQDEYPYIYTVDKQGQPGMNLQLCCGCLSMK